MEYTLKAKFILWKPSDKNFVVKIHNLTTILLYPHTNILGGHYGIAVVTPPTHPQKLIFFSYFIFKLKGSYHDIIVSSFEMYIDVGKIIAWKQDGPILIIEGPQNR